MHSWGVGSVFAAGKEASGMRQVNIPGVEGAVASWSSQSAGKLPREENKEPRTHLPHRPPSYP